MVLDLKRDNISRRVTHPQDGSQGRDKISISTQDGQSRKISQKEPTNSLTKKVTFTWQREDTVYPTDLSTLQSGRPQVLPPLQT
jgi:hypothetical protein